MGGGDKRLLEFMLCRASGHHWDWQRDEVVEGTPRRPKVIDQIWHCTRCAALGYDRRAVPSYARLKPRRYAYPEGFKESGLAHTGERITRVDYLRELYVQGELFAAWRK